MHIINVLLKTIFSVAVLSASGLSMAQQSLRSQQSERKNTEKMMQDMDHSQYSVHEHTQMMQQMNQEHRSGQHRHADHQHTTDHSQDKNAQEGDHHARH